MSPTPASEPNRHGRTSWWPCDAAEHDRELIVELGEEFGPAAHALTRIMKDLAQAQRDSGNLRTGFRVLAAKAHLAVQTGDAASARDLARRIVERAGEIGWMDDLHIDADGRRFAARISGWGADGVRGRAAIKKAEQRDLALETGTSAPVVPLKGDVSPFVPLNRTEQSTTGETPAAAVAPAAAALHPAFADVMAIAQEACSSADNMSPPLDAAILSTLNAYPGLDHLRAARLAAADVLGGLAKQPHFHRILGWKLSDQAKAPPGKDRRTEREQREAGDLEALRSLREGIA
jgi:hypothetical protein